MLAFFTLLTVAAASAVGLRLRRSGRWWGLAVAGTALLLAALLVPDGLALDKILARLVLPAGLAWLALSASAWMAVIRGQDRKAGLRLAAALLVWLAGAPVVGDLLIDVIEAPFRDIEPLEGPRLDAVVVLGGGTSNVEGRPRLDMAGDRVLLGAQLYRVGRARRLVTTGSSLPALGPPRDLTEETAAIWQSLGVPEEAIIRLPDPKNTRQELEAVKAWVTTSTAVRSVGLVTSAWHLGRALAQAERVGLEVQPLPADVRGKGVSGLNLQDYIPAGPGFDAVHRASWELLGRAVGR